LIAKFAIRNILKRPFLNLVKITGLSLALSGILVNDSIVKDPQYGISWMSKLKDKNIDGLDIYWYETFNQKTKDIPSFVQSLLLQKYFEIYGRLPEWNSEF